MYLCIYVFMVVAAYCVSDLNRLFIIFAFLPIFSVFKYGFYSIEMKRKNSTVQVFSVSVKETESSHPELEGPLHGLDVQ